MHQQVTPIGNQTFSNMVCWKIHHVEMMFIDFPLIFLFKTSISSRISPWPWLRLTFREIGLPEGEIAMLLQVLPSVVSDSRCEWCQKTLMGQ
jgi:hypothetical protein